MTANFSARRDAVLHELVPHLRADRDERRRTAARGPLDLAEERRATGPEVALQHVAVERVDDDRRPARPAASAAARASAPAFAVCVWRMCGRSSRMIAASRRTDFASCRSATSRWISGTLDDVHAEPLGDVRHRVLAAREAARDEGRVVPARLEPGGEVRDVDRRTAHVQPGDDAQDRIGSGTALTLAAPWCRSHRCRTPISVKERCNGWVPFARHVSRAAPVRTTSSLGRFGRRSPRQVRIRLGRCLTPCLTPGLHGVPL